MICKACGLVNCFDFHVPDEIWKAIMPLSLIDKVVCLNCFDRYASEMGVDYAEYIKDLYFAGNRGNFHFTPISFQNVARR